MNTTIKTSGTCGELVQGIMDGKSFLVTCPVDLYSYVKVNVSKKGKGINCCSSSKWKSKKAIEETLKLFNEKNTGINLSIKSEIPFGKGMASSTADIIGCCVATAKLLNKDISEEEISKIAVSIEPSDGTMFKGIVLYEYLKGKIIKYLGMAPKMKILALDLGGTVDTIKFNKNDHKKVRLSHGKEIRKAFELVEQGIKDSDCSLIGKGSTLSAVLNQDILFKPELEKLIVISKEFNLYGICVAHSGTIAGFLISQNFDETEPLKKAIINKCRKQYKFYDLKLINGGVCL